MIETTVRVVQPRKVKREVASSKGLEKKSSSTLNEKGKEDNGWETAGPRDFGSCTHARPSTYLDKKGENIDRAETQSPSLNEIRVSGARI